MSKQQLSFWPFETEVLDAPDPDHDDLPAAYRHHEQVGPKRRRTVANPAEDIVSFLDTEFALPKLEKMHRHLWFAGAVRPATQLHMHAAMDRTITPVDRIDLHLLWASSLKLYVKPLPRYLLRPAFWRANLRCPDGCVCELLDHPPMAAGSSGSSNTTLGSGSPLPQGAHLGRVAPSCRRGPRRVALGFLYSYACLVSSETDFDLANEKRLLPRRAGDACIEWTAWQRLVREVLGRHDAQAMHPRFRRAELRLSRLNTIHGLVFTPPFEPYLSSWHDYGSLWRDNMVFLAATTVFVTLVLSALQVGLATEALQGDESFQRAAYGFTVFSILGPMGAFGLVMVWALYKFAKDVPGLILQRAR